MASEGLDKTKQLQRARFALPDLFGPDLSCQGLILYLEEFLLQRINERARRPEKRENGESRENSKHKRGSADTEETRASREKRETKSPICHYLYTNPR